jgi:SNF2 family DNA or RNA helicase
MTAAALNNEIRVTDGYLFRESLKEIRGRRYEGAEKAWYVPLTRENAELMGLLGAELDERLKEILAAGKARERKRDEKPVTRMPIRAEPYAHQVEAFNFALEIFGKGRGVALLAEMGTGKTLITIAVAGAIHLRGEAERMLIVCPKSIIGVWEAEFKRFADYEYTLTALGGGTAKSVRALKGMSGEGLRVAAVNYESARILEKELARWKPDFIVCDESSKIKNPQAKQARAMHNLGKAAGYKAILTGTPITNSPLDFFSQYKFADDSIFGGSFYAFRARYAIIGGYGNHQIVGYKNMAELVTKAHSIAFRIKIKDAVKLPDKIDEIRAVELERNAKAIYAGIDRESYAELIQGEVTTRNVLTRLLRLSQCTGGFIRDDENGIVQEVSRAKLEALEDILDECEEQGKKVVVFARFIPEIEAIVRLLKKRKTGYAVIHGGITDRAEQVARFQTEPDCKVFVGQLATTGMGLTLTAASVAVYYSLDFSYANYEQSKARIRRIGQDKRTLYIHLIAKGTVDEKIMDALGHKADIARIMLNEIKNNGGAYNETL